MAPACGPVCHGCGMNLGQGQGSFTWQAKQRLGIQSDQIKLHLKIKVRSADTSVLSLGARASFIISLTTNFKHFISLFYNNFTSQTANTLVLADICIKVK